ncbi:MAG TPA: tetratricopeptide repeat protein [Candidatus Acidoferrales bacterium]|nr:tetratricopeptide repeat protein [Candidatus Acidoferrales bacterium]
MPRASTRITRKALREPDRFLVLTGKALDFVQKNKALCLAFAAAILAIGIASAGWSLYRDRQEQLAAAEFTKALALYRSGKYREAAAGFEAANSYRASPASRYALLYQANSHLELNETDRAVKALEALVERETRPTLLRQLALLTLGYAHETRAQWKEAARAYGEAAQIEGPYRENALLAKARCALEAGDYSGALDSYQSYLKAYPNSIPSAEVELKVQRLKAMVAKAGK